MVKVKPPEITLKITVGKDENLIKRLLANGALEIHGIAWFVFSALLGVIFSGIFDLKWPLKSQITLKITVLPM